MPHCRFLLAPLAALAFGAPAAAEIFKCTEANGAVTYQEAPCPPGTKSGRVEIFDSGRSAEPADKEALWQQRAAEHTVVAGMPRRWVRLALGAPAEMRAAALDGATEVWSYALPDRSVLVGFRNGYVLWARDGPPAEPPAPTPDAGPRLPRNDNPQPRPAAG